MNDYGLENRIHEILQQKVMMGAGYGGDDGGRFPKGKLKGKNKALHKRMIKNRKILGEAKKIKAIQRQKKAAAKRRVGKKKGAGFFGGGNVWIEFSKEYRALHPGVKVPIEEIQKAYYSSTGKARRLPKPLSEQRMKNKAIVHKNLRLANKKGTLANGKMRAARHPSKLTKHDATEITKEELRKLYNELTKRVAKGGVYGELGLYWQNGGATDYGIDMYGNKIVYPLPAPIISEWDKQMPRNKPVNWQHIDPIDTLYGLWVDKKDQDFKPYQPYQYRETWNAKNGVSTISGRGI